MATAAQPSFQETLAKVAQHLEAPDAPSVAVACASLCIMISQQGGERASLEGLAAKLLEVLGRMDSVEVQVWQKAQHQSAAGMSGDWHCGCCLPLRRLLCDTALWGYCA